MVEWTVVTVITALVTLFFAIYNPVSKSTKENTKAMTELTMNIKSLTEKFATFENNNHESHKRIWEHNDEQDNLLKDHEKRLTIMEERSNKA